MKQARKKIVSEKISAISKKKLAMNGGVKPKSEKLTVCFYMRSLNGKINRKRIEIALAFKMIPGKQWR
ncbi:MAG: hypothetical protein HZR80_16455 [Candidatus Heimdallarchaeota archaeon]